MLAVMDDIVEAVEELGQTVEQLHAEAAPGQYEIVTTHDDALQVWTLLPRVLITPQVPPCSA
jgi:glutamine synthetase